jgi:hypothetical protein
MANGRPGRPSKDAADKPVSFVLSIEKYLQDQFKADALILGKTHNSLLKEFIHEIHIEVESIDVKKHELQRLKAERKYLDSKIEKKEADLKCLVIAEAKTNKRAQDDEYILELQKIIKELLANPKDQKYIDIRARYLAEKNGFLFKPVYDDITNNLAKASGRKPIKDKEAR